MRDGWPFVVSLFERRKWKTGGKSIIVSTASYECRDAACDGWLFGVRPSKAASRSAGGLSSSIGHLASAAVPRLTESVASCWRRTARHGGSMPEIEPILDFSASRYSEAYYECPCLEASSGFAKRGRAGGVHCAHLLASNSAISGVSCWKISGEKTTRKVIGYLHSCSEGDHCVLCLFGLCHNTSRSWTDKSLRRSIK